MKKLFTLFLLGCGLSASAQNEFQVNGSFDGEWEDCTPWTSENNTTKHGKQPQGWKISHVYKSSIAKAEVASEVEGNVEKAVKLSNVNLAGQNIPAYISLGTPWATAETKLTTVRNADGGTFGGVSFTHHPDAVRLKYKRDNSKGKTERASVIAYLWSGSWTQAAVPGNTEVGISNWGEAKKVDMIDRDRNILGMEPTATGGAVTCKDGKLIASVEQYIEDSNSDWQTLTAELNYGDFAGQDVSVEKLNIIISANDYFADRDNIVSGNSLTIDDVELVYYHALSALSYEGATLNFDEATTSYDLSSEFYYEDKLSYTKKGQAASVSTSYDKESAVLTIRVEGEDISVNPDSYTVYTVQFRKALNSVLSAAAFGEEAVNPVEGETVAVDHIYNAEKFTLTCEEDANADIKREFDEETGLLTVTVTGSDASYYTENVHTYKFQFNLPLSSVLSTVTFDDEEYAIDAERIVVIDHLYDADSFETVSEADPEAEISCDYDEATGLLTVTVTGSDADENPSNVHTYKYQFNLPFNSEISSVTYAGETLDLADGETTVVDHIYKEGQLDVVCAGDQNAAVEESYDPETGLLTVTVTGSDVDENPSNVHVYKFQFNLPLNSVLSGVTYEGKEIAFSETGTTTIEGSYDKDAFSFECEGGADATIEQEYDEETRTVTITVTGSDADENAENVHVYKFQFTVAVGINSLFTTSAHDVYTLSGVLVRKNATTLSGLPAGVYVVAGKKVLVK